MCLAQPALSTSAYVLHAGPSGYEACRLNLRRVGHSRTYSRAVVLSDRFDSTCSPRHPIVCDDHGSLSHCIYHACVAVPVPIRQAPARDQTAFIVCPLSHRPLHKIVLRRLSSDPLCIERGSRRAETSYCSGHSTCTARYCPWKGASFLYAPWIATQDQERTRVIGRSRREFLTTIVRNME